MARNGSSDTTISHDYIYSYDHWNGSSYRVGYATNSFDYALVVWKGVEPEYGKTLGLLKLIDLSSNNLFGEIPGGVTSLLELRTLNLSRNNMTRNIPKEIGRLKELISLDLSSNQLSGEIPGSLADISFLGYSNLSNNQLSGKLPGVTQLQSFDASSYLGNSEQCGHPLPKKCSEMKQCKIHQILVEARTTFKKVENGLTCLLFMLVWWLDLLLNSGDFVDPYCSVVLGDMPFYDS